mgnify:CR=1 FL=1
MRNKKFLIIALLVMLTLSACVPSNSAPQRTLNVNGIGQINLVPDVAYIYIGVHTETDRASNAVSENNTQTSRVIKALQEAGVDTKDISTSNFSIWPIDKYDPMTGISTGEKSYSVDNTVYVTVRDLGSLGDLLDAVIAAGANTINSIQFDVADKDTALAQAREAAVKNAQEQAAELSALADVTLGEIQNIAFYDNVPYPVNDGYGKGGGGAAAESAVPIQPGEMTLQVTVSLTYSIK